MSIVDLLLGEKPRPYAWRDDPRARPSEEERQNLDVHVDECTIRQIEIKQMFAQTRIDRYHDRKVLYAIILLVAGSNIEGIGDILKLFFP